MKNEELSEKEISEIYESETLEREVGDVFWHEGAMFLVAEDDGRGCDGCSLYLPDDYPCLSVHDSGACTLRTDGKNVVFITASDFTPKHTKAYRSAKRERRKEEKAACGEEKKRKPRKKKEGSGRVRKNKEGVEE